MFNTCLRQRRALQELGGQLLGEPEPLILELQNEVAEFITKYGRRPHRRQFGKPEWGLRKLAIYRARTGLSRLHIIIDYLGFDDTTFVTAGQIENELRTFVSAHGRPPLARECTRSNGLRPLRFYGNFFGCRYSVGVILNLLNIEVSRKWTKEKAISQLHAYARIHKGRVPTEENFGLGKPLRPLSDYFELFGVDSLEAILRLAGFHDE